jgi:hypothetical protein
VIGGGVRRGRVARWLVAAVCALATPRCGGSGAGGASDGGAGLGATITTASWHLAWDTSGVASDGATWTVQNDLGYVVALDAGFLVDDAVTLGACDPTSTTALDRFVAIPSARAHDVTDPSSIALLHVEDLVHPSEPRDRWSSFPAARYCRALWLVARTTQPLDEPRGVDVVGKSLVANGTWARGDATGSFAVSTWWPHGKLVDLDAAVADRASLAAADADGRPRAATITVRRRLASLFDGIDFSTASADEIAGGMLDDLVGTATIEVVLSDAP